ncbi:methyltransferase family protein [Caldithrix abyssi]
MFYSVIHSLFASDWIKRYVEERLLFFAPYYRFTYNVTQTALLLWLFHWLPRPGGYLWNFEGTIYWFYRSVQLAGVIGFVLAVRQFDLQEFLGIKQLKRFTKNQNNHVKIEQHTFTREGLFRYMRHPLYFFAIVIFLFEPRMSVFKFLLLVWLILYFWIGSLLEEKRMVNRFGEEYKKYQQEVGRFIPKISLVFPIKKKSNQS